MQLSKHFTLEEFEKSQTATRKGIKNKAGAITYTQMLNSKGGIESDLTVTCIEENEFRVVTGSGVRTHDKKHILKHLDLSVSFKDITDDFACFGIFGPKSRELLIEIFGD